MTYIFEKLIPVLSIIIGWFLGVANQRFTYSRQDKIKLKRLLYNLMELRYWIEKEIKLDHQLTMILDLYIVELQKQLPLPSDQLPAMKTMMTGIIRKQFLVQPKLPDLENSIANIIKELAEVDPVFAFELTGKFHVTEKITMIQSYLEEVEVPEGEDSTAKDRLLENVLRPQIMDDVIKQLDDYISTIAGMIGRKTLKKVKSAVYEVDEVLDSEEVLSFLKSYIPRLLSLVPQNEMA